MDVDISIISDGLFFCHLLENTYPLQWNIFHKTKFNILFVSKTKKKERKCMKIDITKYKLKILIYQICIYNILRNSE